MALGFVFTEWDEWRMLIAKDNAKRYMANYGKGRMPMKDDFFKPTIKKVSDLVWKEVDGIVGYKFKIENGELKCINAKKDRAITTQINKNGSTYFSIYQNGMNKAVLTLKVAYCLKYGLSINDKELASKRFCGTAENPEFKKSKYAKAE